MRASIRLLVAMATAAIAVGSVGGSASAAAPHIAVVQGIPGTRVDVCIGSNEVRSRMPYGAWFERDVAAGSRVIRFRSASAGNCSGKLLVKRNLTLGADDDLTIVLTAKEPKRVLVFDNAALGTLEPSVVIPAQLAFRNAADLGDVTFKIGVVGQPLTPVPAADPVWAKGDQEFGPSSENGTVAVVITRPDSNVPLASTASAVGGSSVPFRHEWYALGTKAANAKLVMLVRVIEPEP